MFDDDDDTTPLGVQETEQVQIGNECLDQVRISPFSPWPHTNPSRERMAEAGFQLCNVRDRTICLDCNLICERWKSHLDDPCEVHKIFSPNCPFVKSKLERRNRPHAINFDLSSTVNTNNDRNGTEQQPALPTCDEIVLKRSQHPSYEEIPQRHASFINWSKEASPSVDDLARAGFFYTGTQTIVTCFYCNGSLQDWRPSDDPLIEHARWFPHCAYARQLCGDDLFRRIHESQPGKLDH